MSPTLQDGDLVIIRDSNKEIHRKDMVVFYPPKAGSTKGKKYIKRVLGLPGDTIKIYKQTVYVNGKKIKEKYVKNAAIGDYYPETTLKKDEFFVLGDNRCNSDDSRNFGVVKRERIIGVVRIR